MSRTMALVGWLVLLGLTGCNSGSSSTPTTSTGSSPAAKASEALPDEKAELVTSGEYYDFCQHFEEMVMLDDEVGANQAFDFDALFSKLMLDIEMSGKDQADFKAGMKKAMERDSFANGLVKEIRQGGAWTFLHLRKQRGNYYAWYRMKTGGGGLNYHLVHLHKNPQNEIKVEDVYIMLAGEKISDMARPFAEQAAQEMNRKGLNKFLIRESELVKHMPQFLEMQAQFRAQDFQGARKQYEAMPPSVQSMKAVLIIYLVSCANLDDMETYDRVISEMRQRDPNDGCLDLLSVDTYYAAKQYDRCLESLNRIEKIIGGDPDLSELRSNICVEKGDFDKAVEQAEQLRDSPGYELAGNWQLVGIALRRKDHPEVARLLTLLEKDFAIEFLDFTQQPEYADFVQSPEYQAWMQRERPQQQEQAGESTGP